MNTTVPLTRIRHDRNEAERKAWDSLARYKFHMFGYWAAAWVKYNQLDPQKSPSPFSSLVRSARKEIKSVADKQLQLNLK